MLVAKLEKRGWMIVLVKRLKVARNVESEREREINRGWQKSGNKKEEK